MLKTKFKALTLGLAFLLIANFVTAQTIEKDTTVKYNQYGKIVTVNTLEAEAQNGILVFSSEDGKYKYWFDNRVYFDGLIGLGDPLNDIGNGVDIRRARFALKATVDKNWYGEIDLDFAGAEMEIKDMIIKYQRDTWNIKAGHFKEGFSMESTTTSRYVTFIERSLVNDLAPSRHLGFQANYFGKHFLAIGGVHFRAAGELEETTFAKDNNKDFGISDGVSYTGRLVYMPIQEKGKVVHIGVGASYRTPKSDLEVPNSYRYSTRSLTSINRKKYIDTDDVMNVTSNILANVELAASWNQFMFQGEYIVNQLTRGEVIDDEFTRIDGVEDATIGGAYAQVGMLLFGGSYVYNNKEGEFTQVNRGKDWGDIELAFRFDYMNASDYKAEVYGGAANALTFGINYHVNDNVKFMLNYSYLDHDRFANGKGKLNIYQDEAGDFYSNPFDVEIPTGEGGDDYSIISARIEIDF